jgi:DNA-binding beta-propeller fold protein YncE
MGGEISETEAAAPCAARPRSRASRFWLLAWVAALLVALMIAAAPALAARGHVFDHAFGEPCLVEPCEPGKLKEPDGVAVNEATGTVYVVDRGNNRVEIFNSTGTKIEGEFNGPSATGTGSLTEGSTTIESVLTVTGAFTVGEEISGEGIPAETTVTGVPGGGVLEISQPVEAGKSGLSVELKAHQSFSEPVGIAVDNACVLHEPAPLTEETTPTCAEYDPSNGDVYVADGFSHKAIDKFSSTGAYIGQIAEVPETGPFGEINGVAVDTTGDLWATAAFSGGVKGFVKFGNAAPNEFLSFNVPTKFDQCPQFLFNEGFAVDSKENLYAGITAPGGTFIISLFASTGEQLSCTIDEEEATGVATELPTDDVYVDNVGAVARFDPSGALVESLGVPDMHGRGVAVSSTAGQVYVADSPANVVNLFVLEGPGPPTVENESVSKVTASSATFAAEINPRGAGTEYHFEYGPCSTPTACATTAYVKRLPISDEAVGSDFEVHRVSVHPQDLIAGTVYHFRVVAENAHGPDEQNTERTFTTQPTGGFALPDARQWEMVSPPDKHGALIKPIGEATLIQVAASGVVAAYQATAPTGTEPQGYSNDVQVLSRRVSSGWASDDVATPNEMATGLTLEVFGREYRFFSDDLSLSVVQPFGAFDPSLSEEASEQTVYLRTDYQNGDVSQPCLPASMRCYRPLVTGKPGYANVPPDTVFGAEVEFVGATPDLAHVVLTSTVPLTETTPVAVNGGLYEWSGGRLQLVSVLPNGEPDNGAFAFGFQNRLARHAISDDGARIVWSTGGGGEEHLYLRDTVKGETVQLDAGLEGAPAFQAANSDVSKVLFLESGDLYEYDVAHGERVPITEGAEVVGEVPGASEDGSSLYFVANGVLASGAVPGKCKSNPVSPAGATCNLYYEHYDGTRWEAPELVAVLSGEDFPDWGGVGTDLRKVAARISPNGRWLAFMSKRKLSGYDNRDAVNGHLDEEVYLFDATRPVSVTNPVCASCNPTGARPAGTEYGDSLHLYGGDRVWSDTTWLAANIPGWTAYMGGRALHQSRYLSDSGRLFFNSSDALNAQDVNGTWDVYQYEPPGVGECSASSVTFSERSGGCVGLISSGTSPVESAFLDASEGGGDVFFLTAARLLPQDSDTSLDVYDAHECTGSSPCFPQPTAQPPPCVTEASCRAAPSPQPVFPSSGVGTAAVFGEDNLTASVPKPAVKPKRCRRGFVKKHGRCVKKKARKVKRSASRRRR